MQLRSAAPRRLRPSPPSPRRVAGLLLQHFRTHARDLPWRRTNDPYAIWVSEIMLQQTQVATVVPFFDRWMAALPNVASLAAASADRLLGLWAGLGYYARPRRMQEAARTLLERFPGRWPQTVEEWKSLPGIGDYTAGAICSIAFDQPAPAVDGNVGRVLSRLWGVKGAKGDRRHQRWAWQVASELVTAAALLRTDRQRNCADFNQALMELGALLCTPQRPRCGTCPLAGVCVARRLGNIERFTPATRRPAPLKRCLRVWIVRRRGRVLVRPESGHGWNRGLWQFPTEDLTQEPAASEGHAPSGYRSLFRIPHAITRYRFQVEVVEALTCPTHVLACNPGKWLPASRIPDLPLSGLHRKIATRLRLPDGRAGSRPGARKTASTILRTNCSSDRPVTNSSGKRTRSR